MKKDRVSNINSQILLGLEYGHDKEYAYIGWKDNGNTMSNLGQISKSSF